MFGTARRNSFCVFAVNLPRNRVVNKKELPEDLVAAWTSLLLDVFEKQKREQAQVLVASSVFYRDPRLDGEQIVYVAGHEVEASRTRGRVPGFEFVRQCREELEKAGVAAGHIGPMIIMPWLTHVCPFALTVNRSLYREAVVLHSPRSPRERRTLGNR
jgi:hypothetical protein